MLSRLRKSILNHGVRGTIVLSARVLYNLGFNLRLSIVRSALVHRFSSIIKASLKFIKVRGMRSFCRRALGALKTKTVATEMRRLESSVPLNRRIRIPSDTKHLLVSNNFTWASHYYRAENIYEALRQSGLKTFMVSEGEFDLLDWSETPLLTHVWFFRTKTQFIMNESLRRKISNLIVIFDVDDLTFSPDEYNEKNVPVLKTLEKADKNWLTVGYLWRQVNLLKDCDLITSPTDRIIFEAKSLLDLNGLKIRNVLPAWFDIQSRNNSYRLRCLPKSNSVVIGYESGSNTHMEDFREASKALFRILSNYPNVFLHIYGFKPFIEEDYTPNVKEQIRLFPPREFKSFLEYFPQMDIAIAPLQSNAYTESKSELKFVHAGAHSIPIVSSPSEPFKSVINPGINGFLAFNESDWYSTLEQLVLSRELRQSIGDAAHKTVLEKYQLSCLSSDVAKIDKMVKRQAKIEPVTRSPEFLNRKPVIYTALFGAYENLLEQNRVDQRAFNLVCFSDSELDSKTWNIEVVKPLFPNDSSRSSRHPKIMANEYLGNETKSLYIDNSVYLEKMDTAFFELNSNSVMKLFRHSFHESLEREFLEVLQRNLDSQERVLEQYLHYKSFLGELTDIPMYWCGFMARDHRNKATWELMECWWQHLLRYSRRDQLSFSFNVFISPHRLDILNLDNHTSPFHRWPVAERRIDRAKAWQFDQLEVKSKLLGE